MISDVLDFSGSSLGDPGASRIIRLIALGIILHTLYNILYNLVIYPFYTSPLRHLPGPKDNFSIFGQGFKLLRAPWVPHLYRDWAAQDPDSPFVRFLGVGSSETLVATSIDAYREILQTENDSFVKPELTRKIANTVVGDGLPFAYGHCHRQRKAALTKLFSVNNVKPYVPALQFKAAQLADTVANTSGDNSEVEVETGIWKATLDLIGVKALGTDLNHLQSSDVRLHNLFSRTMQQSFTSHIIHYFSSYLPLRHILPIKANNEFVRDTRETRRIIQHHLESRQKSGVGDKEGNLDALQIMAEKGNLWDDDEAIEHALNLLVLGHDTTACSLVWSMHALSEHPEHQDRLRDEISALNSRCQDPTYDDIEKLRSLENFLLEVLRVYCPVAYIPREATRDVVIAGIPIPKGTVIHLSPAVINMHPRIWGDDAQCFDPTRWENLQGDAATAYAFQSFHNGPRMCIGKTFSMMEMKVILMEMISRFRIEAINDGQKMEFASPSFTLRPKDKLKVRLRDV